MHLDTSLIVPGLIWFWVLQQSYTNIQMTLLDDQALTCVQVALPHPQLYSPDPQPAWS